MPGKWQIINGVKYPTEHNTESRGHVTPTPVPRSRSFIHGGKEWTDVKTIGRDQVLEILAKESRQMEMDAAQTLLHLRETPRDPLNWHCGTGSCKKALENYDWCQKEKCAIIGFHEKEPKTTKGGTPAWKQARSFIREVQLNDQLFLHNSSRGIKGIKEGEGIKGGKGFVTHQGIFTGEIVTNDSEVLNSEVKSAIPEGVRVTFVRDLNDYRPPGWPKDAETTEGGKLIFYKIKVREWVPLKNGVKGAGVRATLYTNDKTATYPNPQ